MNVNKKTQYTIAMTDREMEALFYFMRIVNNIIEHDDDDTLKDIAFALDFELDSVETHQDYMIEFIDELKFAQ